MKKFKFILSFVTLLSLFLSVSSFSQTISINSTFDADTIIYPFQSSTTSYGLTITGHIELNNDTSLVRAVLITSSGDEFMIYEAYPLITQDRVFDIADVCDETCYMDGDTLTVLRIEIIDGEITVNSLYNSTGLIQNAAALQQQEKRNNDLLKVDILKTNVANMGFNWTPGDNSVVEWFYAQKKQYWGEKYNLLGYDYYTGGIYEAPGVLKATRVYPNDRPPFEDLEASSLKLMPNPAKNYVIIAYDLGLEKGQGIILIRDTKGVLVKNLGLHQTINQFTLELNSIPSGMYIVSLYAGNKHIESRQLSVTR
jgi:hypothetical protein